MADLNDDIDELVELLKLRKSGEKFSRRKFERLKMLLLRHADDLVESALSVASLDTVLESLAVGESE